MEFTGQPMIEAAPSLDAMSTRFQGDHEVPTHTRRNTDKAAEPTNCTDIEDSCTNGNRTSCSVSKTTGVADCGACLPGYASNFCVDSRVQCPCTEMPPLRSLEEIKAASIDGDASACFYGIWAGAPCASKGGVYLLAPGWYMGTDTGSGDFLPLMGVLNKYSCGVIVENFNSLSEQHAIAAGTSLKDRKDIVFDGAIRLSFQTALTCSSDEQAKLVYENVETASGGSCYTNCRDRQGNNSDPDLSDDYAPGSWSYDDDQKFEKCHIFASCFEKILENSLDDDTVVTEGDDDSAFVNTAELNMLRSQLASKHSGATKLWALKGENSTSTYLGYALNSATPGRRNARETDAAGEVDRWSKCADELAACFKSKDNVTKPDCAMALDVERTVRDTMFFKLPFVRSTVDCLERFYMNDLRLSHEVGCAGFYNGTLLKPGSGDESSQSLTQLFVMHNGNGECVPGIKCRDGRGTRFDKIVCDGTRDCIDGSDEFIDDQSDPLECARIKADPAYKLIPDPVRILTEDQQKAEVFYSLELGVWAKWVIALFIVGAVGITYAMINSREVEKRRLDTTNGSDGEIPGWAKTPRRRSAAKVWNLMWEFKAVPIIAYSFYAMILSSVSGLSSQQLDSTCLTSLTEVRWDTSLCSVSKHFNGCSKTIKPIVDDTVCAANLKATNKDSLFTEMLAQEELLQDPNNTIADNLQCSCTIESEKRVNANTYAVPLTIISSLALVGLVASVLFTEGVLSAPFGTLDYFVAVSNSKRGTMYTVMLVINVIMLVVSVIIMLVLIERTRANKEVNEDPYNTVYQTLAKDTLLQMMAYTDLWARIPPSNALAMYKDHFNPKTGVADGPQTLGQMDASWTWFMTAEDTLEIAEDGFLFYYFSHDLPNLIQSTGKAKGLVRPLKTTQDAFAAEEGSAVAGIASEAIHHAYIAQRLSPQYWKGGVTFQPKEEAKRRYSFKKVVRKKVAVSKGLTTNEEASKMEGLTVSPVAPSMESAATEWAAKSKAKANGAKPKPKASKGERASAASAKNADDAAGDSDGSAGNYLEVGSGDEEMVSGFGAPEDSDSNADEEMVNGFDGPEGSDSNVDDDNGEGQEVKNAAAEHASYTVEAPKEQQKKKKKKKKKTATAGAAANAAPSSAKGPKKKKKASSKK